LPFPGFDLSWVSQDDCVFYLHSGRSEHVYVATAGDSLAPAGRPRSRPSRLPEHAAETAEACTRRRRPPGRAADRLEALRPGPRGRAGRVIVP
jgi:hypothetical protein